MKEVCMSHAVVCECIAEDGLDAILSDDRVPILGAILGIEWHEKLRITNERTCDSLYEKTHKRQSKNPTGLGWIILLIFYSNSSASSTASSMNWFTKLRESIRMPTQIKTETSEDNRGRHGKRKRSARFQTPRQKRMIADPTRSASRRLFQSSARVCLFLNIRRFIQTIGYSSSLADISFFCKKIKCGWKGEDFPYSEGIVDSLYEYKKCTTSTSIHSWWRYALNDSSSSETGSIEYKSNYSLLLTSMNLSRILMVSWIRRTKNQYS